MPLPYLQISFLADMLRHALTSKYLLEIPEKHLGVSLFIFLMRTPLSVFSEASASMCLAFPCSIVVYMELNVP